MNQLAEFSILPEFHDMCVTPSFGLTLWNNQRDLNVCNITFIINAVHQTHDKNSLQADLL